ncbi:uncharacterized protein LOC110432299 [Sorghum bicolor]|uniref:uncharacterized protein LOC110432299 n=1 Tax=Sorghum bicolor TaxID=4558 RepID=UPI000B42522A|nr:uncharacterized protein LOC110432299 [Sorghum bicolor]|eukprot:XP_021308083.1 uncharacterized protein LOC110432299 [Sorghum bicolor]
MGALKERRAAASRSRACEESHPVVSVAHKAIGSIVFVTHTQGNRSGSSPSTVQGHLRVSDVSSTYARPALAPTAADQKKIGFICSQSAVGDADPMGAGDLRLDVGDSRPD